MERELLLTVKGDNYSEKKINVEINTIKRFLPFIESFSSFLLNCEVIDLGKHAVVTKTKKLKTIFEEGADAKSYYFVICKN
ncbi:MAG TPA: hypothetical protein VHB48_09830 [Chitinophagaceae bacterium]|jgi:hypothetical protein|nr:hypothetical protein [Chitinophagaceae bacterium]